MTENEIAKEVVDAAFQVHQALGPGLLESVYREAFAFELGQRGLRFVAEHTLPVVYKGVRLTIAFRADFLVEDKLVVELKAVESMSPLHKAQILNYLRLTRTKLGLLINFNVQLIRALT